MNKNLIPFDPRKPLDPSGIRMGTPALTTRGLREDAMRQVAAWIVRVLAAPDDKTVADHTAAEVARVRSAIIPSPPTRRAADVERRAHRRESPIRRTWEAPSDEHA